VPEFIELVDRYIASFNETDPTRRRQLVEQLYTEDAAYVDPRAEVRGPAQIDAFLAAAQQQLPGFAFTLGGDVDAHHSQARFHWHATAPGADEPAVVGFDVLVAEDGKVRSVYGFIDKAPVA
jgi:hypothetical protein